MFNFFLKSLFCLRLFVVFIFLLNISSSQANDIIVKNIKVTGEQRLSESFVKKFVPDIKDGIFDNEVLNDLTKNLYMTGFFSNVKINIVDNTLEIIIKEFPIINKISFSGNDILSEDELDQIVSI